MCVPACHKPPFSGRPALSEAFICSCLASLLSSSTSTLHSRRQPHLALDWNCAARMSAASCAFRSMVMFALEMTPGIFASYETDTIDKRNTWPRSGLVHVDHSLQQKGN